MAFSIKFRWFLVLIPALFISCTDSSSRSTPFKDNIPSGKSLYVENCASCHGIDGKLGLSGAKDLSISTLNDQEIETILQTGKKAMPPMAPVLETNENLNLVIQHIKKLRKND